MDQRLGGFLQLFLGLGRFEDRPVERTQRLGQQLVLARDPVEPPGGGAQLAQRRVRTFPDMAQFLKIARQALALLHRSACLGQPRFLARLRFDLRQFGKVREQQVLFRAGGVDCLARFFKRVGGALPFAPVARDLGGIGPCKPVEQQAVPARVHEAAVVVLAVQFDEDRSEIAQQADTRRLVVDEGLRPAIGLDLAADDQRLPRFDLDSRIFERFGQRSRKFGEFEAGGHARLLGAAAHEAGLGAITQH